MAESAIAEGVKYAYRQKSEIYILVISEVNNGT
jgi:hypothetical protein